MVTKIPIVEWDDREDIKTRSILRVPYIPLDEVIADVNELDPELVVLLPPYKQDDPVFNARSTSILYDKVEYEIMTAVAISGRLSLQDYVRALIKANHKSLAVPYRFGTRGQYLFTSLMEFLHGVYDDTVWFHVAGGMPQVPDGWRGQWTWSDEEL